jgi:hypothetical protein
MHQTEQCGKQQIGFDTISFGFEVILNPDKSRTDEVYSSGLYIEDASWNAEKGELTDPRTKELFQEMPLILLIPISNRKSPGTECIFNWFLGVEAGMREIFQILQVNRPRNILHYQELIGLLIGQHILSFLLQ